MRYFTPQMERHTLVFVKHRRNRKATKQYRNVSKVLKGWRREEQGEERCAGMQITMIFKRLVVKKSKT